MSLIWRGLRGKVVNITVQSEQFLLEYIKKPKYAQAWQTYFLADTQINIYIYIYIASPDN